MAGVAVDDEGYPTIFGELIEGMQALQEDGVAVDDEGYPTIFGELLEGMQALQEDEVASGSAAGAAAAAAAAGAVAPSVVAAAGAAEDTLPNIRPINPNVRARKLQVNAVANKKWLKRMQQKALHQQSTRS
jgi:precorrin-4 methylase